MVPPLALIWFMVGALPAATASPRAFGALAALVVGLTWWLLRGGAASDEQRFEITTLQRFVPVFALYLVVASLWPPFRTVVPWHGAVGFANRLNGAGVVDVLILLEQVGGFTLLGYAMAEWRGRRELSLGRDLPLVVGCAAPCWPGRSNWRRAGCRAPARRCCAGCLRPPAPPTASAVYHLARAHVRALRASDAAVATEAA